MCSAAAHTLQLTHSPKCNQHEKRDMLRHWTVIVFLGDLVYQVIHSIIAGQWRRQRNRHNWPTSPVQFVVFLDIAISTVVRMLHWKGLGPLFEGLCFCFRRESINQINDYQKHCCSKWVALSTLSISHIHVHNKDARPSVFIFQWVNDLSLSCIIMKLGEMPKYYTTICLFAKR